MVFEISTIRRTISKIVDKINSGQNIFVEDISPLIDTPTRTGPIGRMALKVMTKTDYLQIKSFSAGLTQAFEKADQLAKSDLFKEAMIPINGIRKMSSDLLGKTKEKVLSDWGGDIESMKTNIRDVLNQLAAAIVRIRPGLRKAAA